MKRTLILSGAICALLVSAIFAFGDIARPKPSPQAKEEAKTVLYTGLEVTTDAKAYEARLQISRDTLERIAKEAAGTPSSQSMTQNLMHSSTRTIMAGLFMFLAVSFAGVWLARSGQRRNVKVSAAVLVIAFMFGAATVMVRANAGPPGYIYWQSLPNNLTNGKSTSGGVSVEIVPDNERIKLIIPMRKKNPSEE